MFMPEILTAPTFCRRRKGQGIYIGCCGKETIRLIDRQIYMPKDPKEIKFLMEDPEIEILCADEKEQKEENARNKEKDKSGIASSLNVRR